VPYGNKSRRLLARNEGQKNGSSFSKGLQLAVFLLAKIPLVTKGAVNTEFRSGNK